MIGVLIFAAAVLAQGAAPTPEQPAADQPAAVAAAAPEAAGKAQGKKADDPLVCRTEKPVGSHLARRSCLPKSVRDERERQAKEITQRAQRGGLGPWLEK